MTSRSRPGSDRPHRPPALLLAAVLASLPAPALAQDQPGRDRAPDQAPVVEVPAPILTVDQERLFADSAFGRRVSDEIERRSQELAAENRNLEAVLIAEEQALTDLRPTLPPEEFRSRADAFDEKVQRIRAEQDAKAADLGRFQEQERQRFGTAIGGVLTQIVRERGALAVMDRRALLVSAESIDITEAAISRMDAELGDGGTP